MVKRIVFEGRTHEFPDDFTDQDISRALSAGGQQRNAPRSSSPTGRRPGAQTVTPLTGRERAADAEARLRAPQGAPGTPLRALEDFNRGGVLGVMSQAWRNQPWSDELAGGLARLQPRRPAGVSPDDMAGGAQDNMAREREEYRQRNPGGDLASYGVNIAASMGRPIASSGLVPTMLAGGVMNVGANAGYREGDAGQRLQARDVIRDFSIGAAVPLAFRAAGDTINLGRGAYRYLTGANRRAPHPLENRFGPILTEGERTGDVGRRLEEDALRRGAGSTRAQAIMRGHDARRAPQVREQLTRVATRDLPALSENADEAGVVLADSLRTSRQTLHERQSQLYDEAFNAAKAEPVPASDDLPASIAASQEAEGFRIPPAAQTEIDELHDVIRRGAATQANVQRTRQRLNRLRTTAINGRDDAAEYDITQTIRALDQWRAGKPRDPAALRLMNEADAVHSELRQLFSPQGRVALSTGHAGRVDLGGRAVDRVINTEGEGAILDAILGKGVGSSQAALAAVRRIRRIGTGRIKYTNTTAPSGVRVPGRVASGRAGDASRLDMRLDAARRFAADTPESPAARRYFGGQAQQPLPELQALREGVVHRLSSNWDRYIRSIDEGQAGLAPVRMLWRDLDKALNGSGRPVMQELFTPTEMTTLREFQDFVKRMIPPDGVNTSNTFIAIARAIKQGFDRLVGLIPGVGPLVREVGEQFGATQAARQAVRPPGRPVPPITDNLPTRLGQAGMNVAASTPPEAEAPLGELTGVSSFERAGANIQRGDLPGAANEATFGALAMTPFMRPLTAPLRTAALGAGALTIGGIGNAEAREQDRQTQAQLEEARASVRQIEEELRIFDEINPNDPDTVRAAQQLLAVRSGQPVRVDGVIGPETSRAFEAYRTQKRQELEQARARLAPLEENAAALSAAPAPWHEALRELGPTAAGLGGAYLGHRFRIGAVNKANSRLLAANAEANALLSRGGRAPLRTRAANVNEFWRRGGAGERVPFQPAQTARGFTARPRSQAAEASELYPSQPTRFRGQDLGIMAAGAGEAAASGTGLYFAEQALQEAIVAANENPTEANLTRVERARDLVAVLQAAMRAGGGIVIGRASGAVTHPYANARPNVATAESERMLLSQRPPPRPRSRNR